MTTRAAIVAEFRRWIDIPYLHQGYTKHGVDCIGFIGGVGLALGMESALQWSRDPLMHSYGTSPDPVTLLMGVAQYLTPIADKAMARPGDLFLLNWPGTIPHFAGILDAGPPATVAHAFYSARKVAESRIDGQWRQGTTWDSLVKAAYSYREATD